MQMIGPIPVLRSSRGGAQQALEVILSHANVGESLAKASGPNKQLQGGPGRRTATFKSPSLPMEAGYQLVVLSIDFPALRTAS